MRYSWLATSLVVAGMVPDLANSAAPVVTGISAPAVYDSTGKLVGGVLDLYGPQLTYVIFKINGYVLQAAVNPTGWDAADTNLRYGGGPSYFATANCSGTPYFDISTSTTYSQPNGFSLREFMTGSNQTLWVATPTAKHLTNWTYQSSYDSQCEVYSGTLGNPNSGDYVVKGTNLGNLLGVFTPPFSIQ